MALGAFISTGRTLESALERVRLAEQVGYEAAYVTQIAGRDALTVLAAYAGATERIRLGTGVVPIYTRTPATMAQTAATLDEYSGGRLNLGLGVSHRPVVEGWHGQTIDRPVPEMREYVGIVRAILRGEEAPQDTEKWRTGFRLAMEHRPDLKILVAALSPRMLRLAGEVAEGRRRAGKGLEAFDVVAAVPAAATDDRGAVYGAMHTDLIPYFGLPFYRAMLDRSGFAPEIGAFDAAGGDLDGMREAISDRFLDALTAVGSEDEVRAGVQRYRDAGATSPCVGPIPHTDFDATLHAAAGR